MKTGIFSGEENAFLTKHYRKRGASWCAAQLDRTQPSVWHRADRLGLVRHGWSQDEISALERLWGETSERRLLLALPGRTWQAIATEAKRLKLGHPEQGKITVHAAAELCGVHRRIIFKACKAASVPITMAVRSVGPQRKLPDTSRYRWRMVEKDLCIAAVLAWLNR